MDADETHEDFRESTVEEEVAAQGRDGALFAELMNPWNGGTRYRPTSESEELRRTARAAVEDWLEKRDA